MCVVCGCPGCAAVTVPQLAKDKPANLGQSDQGYRLIGMKWGADTLGTPGGEVTWAANLGGLMIDAVAEFDLAEFEVALQDAFDAWEAVAQVSFRMVADAGDADVTIAFGADSTGGFDLGVPGEVLAVATNNFQTGPALSGLKSMQSATIIFDAAEDWIPSGIEAEGTSFLGVATHEIGHVLGLDHDNATLSVMNTHLSTENLQPGDVAGVREIYGARMTEGSAGADHMMLGDGTIGAVVAALAGHDEVFGTLGDDMIAGGDGDDHLSGRAGDDLLIDTSGGNAIAGGADDDTIIGGRGTLHADGDDGRDTLIGGIGDDVLNGGDGDDILRGDPAGSFLAGNDRLIAGDGDDYLEGGAGADVFVFKRYDDTNSIGRLALDNGQPTIIGRDFEVGVDRIDLSDFGFTTFQALGSALITVGDDTIFAASHTKIIIVGVSEAELSADDFIL
ncbi:MAG: matrixin family metalloprotease [Pseudomonadota bacterium]